jgi:hypothetical protein
MQTGHRTRWVYGLSGVLVLATGVWLYHWWHRPPTVEFDNLRYIQLLRTAVSARRADYVQGVERAIRLRVAEHAMSPLEAAHFDSILAKVHSGNWELADRMAFEFEAAQAHRRRSQPKRDEHDHPVPDNAPTRISANLAR